ncbi:DUF2971 domain-containing protein [Phyllobacterium sp. 0TCS1.6C]|uniref:DUF2971 domain-containing protein n=1 Tax=unclassified Phyllobacterium TaxID=2638441 RepID=UPI002263F89D|nr:MULTISPECIES: DUF2971 domain-containing protein [unclassified Phyllobacterium]MCX8281778.1 DUF2971 domain-containing protein [Phyllobacterium sp. 0TCS1.6C]MCX8295313.1 DUF2971 domain-containing protein [Phyllobacterium sp. 0TCS1.6A]
MAKVKVYSTPLRLYRYRPLGEKLDRELRALTEGYIYCPKFSDMNDPMEGMHRESLAYIMKGRSKGERQLIADEKAKLGIASLSEVFDHEPMWAHYADQFTGMCVAYSTSKLLKALSPDFDLVRMAYNEEPPIILATRASTRDKAKLTLATKTVRWMSEREWRLIIPESGKAEYGDVKCVFRIYLGPRVEPEAERRIRADMEKLKIPVLKMKVDKYHVAFSGTGK